MRELIPAISEFLGQLDITAIKKERRNDLQSLVDIIQEKVGRHQTIYLNFICTHNSRRSQLCQVWAETIAWAKGVPKVKAYSGGTEPSEFHCNAIRALESCRFLLTKKEDRTIPVYFFFYSYEAEAIPCFSKVYNDPINCWTAFTAVMTCYDAEDKCPHIAEAEARVSVIYDDPKYADGTPKETEVYARRNSQIATEMLYVFSKIKITE
ncbi:Arsenate reductase [Fulvivirga imtechensis AK7]|uniref:Arsenate reductase n=1 Tax=Fulvivirga imtechensis AK7 TaxID=1237149 RepID=L8K0A7_9BACT|nr:arsenate reductase [Fulvivirga imtechensis]ELR73364.1 Arsenate reductase [Fulvivirga imtechensis AK7]